MRRIAQREDSYCLAVGLRYKTGDPILMEEEKSYRR
jgi:hypothetical protein